QQSDRLLRQLLRQYLGRADATKGTREPGNDVRPSPPAPPRALRRHLPGEAGLRECLRPGHGPRSGRGIIGQRSKAMDGEPAGRANTEAAVVDLRRPSVLLAARMATDSRRL